MKTFAPRETLDRQLRKLKNDVLILGSMVEMATIDAVDALKRRDIEAGKRIQAADSQINEKRFEMEGNCITLIATQQPMARDLRILASTLEVITELERMGDYAKNIGRIVVMLDSQPLIKPLIDVPRMAEIAVSMLHRALTAFVDEDEKAAREIPNDDAQIDALYNQIYRELVVLMISSTSTIDQANLLLWVAHNLERLADRVTNICERTIYIVTGKMEELSTSDDEYRNGI